MDATNPQTLISQGSCYECYGPLTMGDLMKIVLLSNILLAQNPMAATDPQSLYAYGKCFNCYGPLSPADIMIIALLDQISQGGGTGGGGGGVTCGDYGGGQPTFIPASGCASAIDTSDGTIYWYYSGAWHP